MKPLFYALVLCSFKILSNDWILLIKHCFATQPTLHENYGHQSVKMFENVFGYWN